MSFKKVDPKLELVTLEHKVADFWTKNKIQEKYLHRNDNSDSKFIFYDGPITANNPMGVHHAWGRTYKDLWQRYNTMLGKKQRYQNGFDCQGLWVEVEVEKELGFKTKKDIEEYGIGKFVNKCKERVLRYSAIQTEQSKRLGYFMDWDNSYYTMSDDNNYAIWSFLKRCADKGYLYKGHDVVPWCLRCGTAISQHEILTEEYKELTHDSIYLKLPILGKENEYFLVWTTTPWTLSSNVALAVNPELDYVQLKIGDEVYWLSKGTLPIIEGDFKLLATVKGKKLLGLNYRGPFDELPVQKDSQRVVISWDEVGEEEGTGIVHIAPGCGEEDFKLGKENHLAVIDPLNDEGNYVEGFGKYTGKNVRGIAGEVFEDLIEKGLVFKIKPYVHRYPTCWRCKEELIFRLVDEWYIAMDHKDPDDKQGRTLREQMIDVAKKIKWIPAFGLERELDWLNNMHDWLISKKRYWGLALPIYECGCGHFDVIGSKGELKERAVKGWDKFEGNSPHRPWVDEVEIKCSKCGKPVKRIKDVGNPWLDAGIIPFSTIVDPNTGKLSYTSDKKYWEEWFPADFITESFPGQFKNWFYTMIAMSTVLEDTNSFKTVLGYASVRDEHGEEMHKSKGNAIWFDDAAEEIGVDVMRWLYLRQNPVHNLNFGYHTTGEQRRRLITLWNVYSFFVTYANIDGWRPGKNSIHTKDRSILDRWILSELNQLILYTTKELNSYRVHTVMEQVEKFIEDLSTWYVRRSRRRFWKSEDDGDKMAAYETLYEVLLNLTLIISPMAPYFAEGIYQNLVIDTEAPESVHLCDWPVADKELIDEKTAEEMALVREIINTALNIRATNGIKVRQPLAKITVISPSINNDFSKQLSNIILEEVNVKEISVVSGKGLEVVLDLEITPELKVEGIARDLVRFIQDGRKKAGFNVEDRITTRWQTEDPDLAVAVMSQAPYIAKETLSVKFDRSEPEGEYAETVKLDGSDLIFSISRSK